MSFALPVPEASSPTLPPSKYVFHPIGDLTTHEEGRAFIEKQGREDPTEVTSCSTTFGDDDGSISVDLLDEEIINPYPAYTKTSTEIQEWKDLELSLGENWSWRLAGELSSCEMSVDGTIESEMEEEDFGMGHDTKEEHITVSSSPTQAVPIVEDEEIRKKRNLLWKQSLKTSMFRRQGGM